MSLRTLRGLTAACLVVREEPRFAARFTGTGGLVKGKAIGKAGDPKHLWWYVGGETGWRSLGVDRRTLKREVEPTYNEVWRNPRKKARVDAALQAIANNGKAFGLAVGTAIGTIVPGVGNAVGAAVGGALGWAAAEIAEACIESRAAAEEVVAAAKAGPEAVAELANTGGSQAWWWTRLEEGLDAIARGESRAEVAADLRAAVEERFGDADPSLSMQIAFSAAGRAAAGR